MIEQTATLNDTQNNQQVVDLREIIEKQIRTNHFRSIVTAECFDKLMKTQQKLSTTEKERERPIGATCVKVRPSSTESKWPTLLQVMVCRRSSRKKEKIGGEYFYFLSFSCCTFPKGKFKTKNPVN